jgi:PPOX class probable F420-dependent enzyme
MSSHSSDSSTPDRGRLPHHREAPFQSPDPSTPAGEQILRRLREELFLWFTTVDATGVPHALPAAFLWDEAQSTFLISSTAEEDRDRLTQIQQNPKVGLHFNLDMSGADSFILTGEAKVSLDDPSFDQIPAWVAKYQAFFSRVGLTIQQAAVVSPVALRVRPLTMLARYGGAMKEL